MSGRLWADATNRRHVAIDWSFAADPHLQVGDRYRATLTDAAGVILATKEATAASYSAFATCESTCHTPQFQ